MSPLLLTVLTFGAGVAFVVGVYSILSDLFLHDRRRVNERIDEEFRNKQRVKIKQSPLFKDLDQLAAGASADLDATRGLRARLERMIVQSGLQTTVNMILMLSVGAALTVILVCLLLRRGPLIILVFGLAGLAAPFLFVHYRQKARLEKLLSQLPDTFDLMGRVVRAGQTMPQALQAVAAEFPQPVSVEFAYCYEQQNLGLPTEVAMRDLARRTGLTEVQIFVMAVLVQQQTGGNLAELLDKLAVIIRTRYKIRGQVQALTAEGRLQAIILLALPPALFLIMLVMNPKYALILLEYPGLLGATIACEGLGALWIRKIVNFDI